MILPRNAPVNLSDAYLEQQIVSSKANRDAQVITYHVQLKTIMHSNLWRILQHMESKLQCRRLDTINQVFASSATFVKILNPMASA
jgi:hypothetical protein